MKFTVCLLLLSLLGLPVAAAPLGSSWVILDEFIGGSGNFFATSFNASLPGTLQVTDLFVVGDEYEVYVNGVLKLTTPDLPDYSQLGVNPFADPPFTTDPDVAWQRAAFSKGTVAGILMGDLIEIKAIASPPNFNDNTVAARISGVPEPATVGMVGAALAGLAFLRRRR